MELFIQIKDGKPFEHPILADNFFAVFPGVDPNNLPSEFAKFVRVAPPKIGVYENYEGLTYEMIDGVCTDVHYVVPMTQEQRLQKQNATKEEWEKIGFPSWIFNEEFCRFDPPVKYPVDGKNYFWDESELKWVEVTNA